MSAKTQLNIKNNLDLVGEYVAHIHTHTLTHQYISHSYTETHVCERMCVRETVERNELIFVCF